MKYRHTAFLILGLTILGLLCLSSCKSAPPKVRTTITRTLPDGALGAPGGTETVVEERPYAPASEGYRDAGIQLFSNP